MRVLVVVLVVLGCGRIRFEPRVDAPGAAHRYLYDVASGQVYGYELDLATGLPRAPMPYALPAGTTASAIVADPMGRFAYVADAVGSRIFTLAIDAATGTLTQVDTVTGGGLVKPTALAIDPVGSYLYAVNDLGETISSFAIAGGTLSPVTATPTGITDPYPSNDLRFDPSGQFLYVALDDNSGGVAGFRASGGQLSALPGSPWDLVPALSGPDPYQLAWHPSGHWLFASDQGNGRVLWAAFDPTSGALTPQPTQLTVGGGLTFGFAFDDSGAHLYAGDCGGQDRVYVIAIDPQTGAQSAQSMGPQTKCVGSLLVDSPHALLYVADEGDGLYTYSLAPDGSLVTPALSLLPGPSASLFAIANTRE
jgi:DNA-binding beta-propeller fold protein YncE